MILGFHWFKGYVALLFVVWIVVGCVFLVWIVLLVFLKSQFIFTHLFGHLITGSVGSWVNLWELSFFFFLLCFNVTSPSLLFFIHNSVAISVCSISKICLDASVFLSFPFTSSFNYHYYFSGLLQSLLNDFSFSCFCFFTTNSLHSSHTNL